MSWLDNCDWGAVDAARRMADEQRRESAMCQSRADQLEADAIETLLEADPPEDRRATYEAMAAHHRQMAARWKAIADREEWSMSRAPTDAELAAVDDA